MKTTLSETLNEQQCREIVRRMTDCCVFGALCVLEGSDVSEKVRETLIAQREAIVDETVGKNRAAIYVKLPEASPANQPELVRSMTRTFVCRRVAESIVAIASEPVNAASDEDERIRRIGLTSLALAGECSALEKYTPDAYNDGDEYDDTVRGFTEGFCKRYSKAQELKNDLTGTLRKNSEKLFASTVAFADKTLNGQRGISINSYDFTTAVNRYIKDIGGSSEKDRIIVLFALMYAAINLCSKTYASVNGWLTLTKSHAVAFISFYALTVLEKRDNFEEHLKNLIDTFKSNFDPDVIHLENEILSRYEKRYGSNKSDALAFDRKYITEFQRQKANGFVPEPDKMKCEEHCGIYMSFISTVASLMKSGKASEEDVNDAFTYVERAIGIVEDNPQYASGKAKIYYLKGRLLLFADDTRGAVSERIPEAIACFNKAKSCQDHSPDYYLRMLDYDAYINQAERMKDSIEREIRYKEQNDEILRKLEGLDRLRESFEQQRTEMEQKLAQQQAEDTARYEQQKNHMDDTLRDSERQSLSLMGLFTAVLQITLGGITLASNLENLSAIVIAVMTLTLMSLIVYGAVIIINDRRKTLARILILGAAIILVATILVLVFGFKLFV